MLSLAAVAALLASVNLVVSSAMGGSVVKTRAPLQQALDRFPRQIASADGGQWVAMDGAGSNQLPPEGEPLDADVEKTLGATHPYRLRGDKLPDPGEKDPPKLLEMPQYIQRYYRHLDAAGREANPLLRAYVFVSFYTGGPDPVPHVPERCYLGGGFRQLASRDVDVELNGRPVPIRAMAFGKGVDATNVVYFFHFNGQTSSDHLVVRARLNSPLVKHTYFAKIEVKFPGIQGEDLDAATAAARRVLADFLPILERDFLPDWSQYEGK